MNNLPAIHIQNLTKVFGSVRALDNVSFSVPQGSVFGFLGPNGAGKSTAIRCIMDFIRPTSGHISVLGQDAQAHSVALKHRIGYLSGNVHAYPHWTSQQHINYFARLHSTASHTVTTLAKTLADRLDFDPTRKIQTLSSGNKQKLGIILAFMHQPDVVILDEPTNALDPLLQNAVYALIAETQQRGATVFMSSHNLAEVQRTCHKVAIIKQGRLVAEESIASLQQRNLYVVTAQLRQPVDAATIAAIVPSATVELHTNTQLRFTVGGAPTALLAHLQTLPLADIEITHASLEDIFLAYYQ